MRLQTDGLLVAAAGIESKIVRRDSVAHGEETEEHRQRAATNQQNDASTPIQKLRIHACLLCLSARRRGKGKVRPRETVSRKVDDGNPHRLEPRDIQDFVAIQIVELAVGNEVEIRASNRAGGWQYAQLRTIFED